SLWIEHAWSSSWNAGLGVRWLHERATQLASDQPQYGYPVPIPLAVVEWSPWTDQAFSLSYGTGYRTGGQVNTAAVTYSPERSRNLEFAWRAQWFSGAVHTTLSAFEGRIHDRFHSELG